MIKLRVLKAHNMLIINDLQNYAIGCKTARRGLETHEKPRKR